MATVRKQILLSSSQNERLRKLRAATGISESEIIRRALEAYDPSGGMSESDNEEMRAALADLVEQNAKTARALDSAEAEIAATERFLAELRAQRKAPQPAAARRTKRAPASGSRKKARQRRASRAGSR